MDNTKINFYTGCYSQSLGDMEGNGTGICNVTLNLRTGEMSEPECVAPCINPSYLTWGTDRQTLYATSETVRPNAPAIMSFTRSNDHQLAALNKVELQGEGPCHLSVNPAGLLLTSAQYGSGDIDVFNISDDGSIGQSCMHIQHTGQGPDESRQEGPHAHYTAFFGDKLVAVDLGIDAVLGYTVNMADSTINGTPLNRLQTSPGAGPRHLTVIPGSNTAYILCELSEEILQATLDNDQWNIIDTIPAFKNRHTSNGAAAAIKLSPDLRHLYASGRHQSVIACFEIDRTTGTLTQVDEIETGGTGPRDFSLSPNGEYLVVANQITNNLVSFKRETSSGWLQPTGYSVNSGSPVCVLF